ncbi:hypothetical protein [Brevundimonas sp. Root1279]|uniref:hypothetical protein n=1 Tax=Brevundimonas sp. Root1279 TaxID=1736443 RepID=UPI0006FF1234|nr:hypothetical protein [Brevundimonas sp. Root1279]KQW83607.1 hypothetical protein ASC65_02820 [Brevundimonas sp. Root1279]
MTETYRIRSPETWAQARDDYLAGLDAAAVCRRYDLGLSAFRRRARRQGWRRIDQDDPAPGDLDLAIYDDVTSDDQLEMAYLRFVQALDQGKAVEAARWRRLWLEMRAEDAALDAELFPGRTRAEVAALLAAEREEDERVEDARLLAATAPITPRTAALPAPGPAEKVHDVHSTFSSAHFPPDESPPSSRAERRRLLREARRRTDAAPAVRQPGLSSKLVTL